MENIVNWKSLANISQGTATVGTASTTVLPLNQNRSYALIMNYSGVDITLGLESTAILGAGIILKPNTWIELSGASGNNVRGTVTAIASSVCTLNYIYSGGGI